MQLPGPLKNILRGGRAEARPTDPAPRPARPVSLQDRADEDTVSTRQSRGLEQFFGYIRDQSGLTMLDLGGATQQNVNFITNLGHRLYSEDAFAPCREIWTTVPSSTRSSQAIRIACFISRRS